MILARVTPSIISGTITAPASKSSMQRACAAALIRKGETIIKNPGVSNDDKAAIDVIQKFIQSLDGKQEDQESDDFIPDQPEHDGN